MSFLDMDEVEIGMDTRVEDMDHNLLVSYFKESQQKASGVNLGMSTPDFMIMKNALIGQYGQPVAGRIVKWLFYRYKGKAILRGNPEIATPRTFNTKLKWWVEKLNVEMQMAVAREERKLTAPASRGFATLDVL